MFKDNFFKGGKFFNGFKHDSPFQKGDLKYVILDILKEKPRYGYEIIRYFEERSHGFYKPSPGSVYPTLQMLEEMGHAISKERDSKKIYEITKEGLDFLNKQKDFTDEVKNHMDHHWNPKNFDTISQIIGEIIIIKKSLGPRMIHASSEKTKQIHQIVLKARKEIEAILKE